jgi:WD40 repeat protein
MREQQPPKDLEKSQAQPAADAPATHAQPAWKMVRVLVVFSGHTRAVERCAFSPSGQRSVTASHGSLRVWDVRSGYSVAEVQGPPSPIAAVRFGLDDHEIFAAFGVTVTHVSDRGSLTMTFQSFPSKVLDVAPTSAAFMSSRA